MPGLTDADWHEKLIEECGGYWSSHEHYPVVDWIFEVTNGDTRRGYWDWVQSCIEREQGHPMYKGG